MPQTTAARPHLSIIAAVAANGVIGAGNAMPWHLSEDLKRFRALTIGHPILMGRKTHQSLGRPLPGRRNLVISRDAGFRAEGCETFASLDAALAACGETEEVFVIGGGQIYREALTLADRLHLTEIQMEFAGDTRFPDYDRSRWRETSREHHRADQGWDYDFVVYDRIR